MIRFIGIDIDGTEGTTNGKLMGFGPNNSTTFTHSVFGCRPKIKIKRDYALSGLSCEREEVIEGRTSFTIPAPIINGDGSCTVPPL